MHETVDQYLIQRYEAKLRDELIIHDFPAKKIDETISESSAHLQEAMEAANPRSAKEAETVISQFGSAALLAKKLATEQVHLANRKRFLWPLVLLPIWIYSKGHPIPYFTELQREIYSSPFYSLLGSALLIALGFRARRPVFGSFALVAAGMIICQVAWLSATSYPYKVGTSDSGWLGATRQSDYGRTLAGLNKSVASEQQVLANLNAGKSIFTGGHAPNNMPALYSYQGKYWLPEAVSMLGPSMQGYGPRPEEIDPSLRTDSWQTAVTAWTGATVTTTTMPNGLNKLRNWETVTLQDKNFRVTKFESDADRVTFGVTWQIQSIKNAAASLAWFRTQPIPVRMWAFIRLVAPDDIFYSSVAAMITFLGWLAWLAWGFINRNLRRARISQGRLRTA